MSTTTTASSTSSKSRDDPPADARASPTCARQHGHLCLRDANSCSTSCDGTPRTPNSSHDFGKDIIPYIVKHGKAVAHHFSTLLRASAEDARLLARRRHGRRLLGRQIDLTDIVPELDLFDRDWPIWTYAELTAAGQIRPRRGRAARHGDVVAGLGRLHRLRRDGCAARCCSPACACNSYRLCRATP